MGLFSYFAFYVQLLLKALKSSWLEGWFCLSLPEIQSLDWVLLACEIAHQGRSGYFFAKCSTIQKQVFHTWRFPPNGNGVYFASAGCQAGK
jgi:hypothetical protein